MSIEIETERLVLKNYCKTDLDNLHKLKSDKLVWKYSTKQGVNNIEQTRNCLLTILKNYDKDKFDFQALFIKDNLEYIGEAGILSLKQNYRAVIGYNIISEYWNNGYATEITNALIKYLFEKIKVERIEALSVEENKASRRVLQKSGFKNEGLLRNFAYIDSRYLNVCYYGMIKSDYNKNS